MSIMIENAANEDMVLRSEALANLEPPEDASIFILTKEKNESEIELWFYVKGDQVWRQRAYKGQWTNKYAPISKQEARKRWKQTVARGFKFANKGEFAPCM